ncbi:hypothetical protein LJC61_01590 [Ruminococcaceae bacterium OttesenSCG-928-A16]|nr:hypothetical protein [Ruminococcaceae bacterium OttesenSCG-928-A16]
MSPKAFKKDKPLLDIFEREQRSLNAFERGKNAVTVKEKKTVVREIKLFFLNFMSNSPLIKTIGYALLITGFIIAFIYGVGLFNNSAFENSQDRSTTYLYLTGTLIVLGSYFILGNNLVPYLKYFYVLLFSPFALYAAAFYIFSILSAIRLPFLKHLLGILGLFYFICLLVWVLKFIYAAISKIIKSTKNKTGNKNELFNLFSAIVGLAANIVKLWQ